MVTASILYHVGWPLESLKQASKQTNNYVLHVAKKRETGNWSIRTQLSSADSSAGTCEQIISPFCTVVPICQLVFEFLLPDCPLHPL